MQTYSGKQYACIVKYLSGHFDCIMLLDIFKMNPLKKPVPRRKNNYRVLKVQIAILGKVQEIAKITCFIRHFRQVTDKFCFHN